jgi:1,2-diacylglycerol 3-alpha-glucosyltransferase
VKILHCCLAAFYIDNYSYQENVLPKMHKLLGLDVKILASTETYISNKQLGYVKPSTYFNEDGIEVTRVAYVKWIPGFLGKKIRKYVGVSKVLNDFKPDVIFLHDAQFLSVLEIRRFLKANKEVKLFADCHTDFINSGRGWVSKNILHKLLYKKIISLIEPFVISFYGTLPIRCEFLNEVYGVPEGKIELLCLGADDSIYDFSKKNEINNSFRKKYDIPNENFLIITGGKIDERKKIHFLLEGFKNVEENSISLVVFGVPNKKMEDVIKPYTNIKNIVFTGWMDSKGIYEIMLSADLAIYPGTHSVLWEQSIGVGIPCVFKRWKGIEHVDVGGNCIFLEDSNVDEITSVLTKVIKEKELYKELKANAMSHGPSNFAYSEIAKKAIKI